MKRSHTLLLVVCFVLCLSLLSACDLNGLVEWANSALEQLITDTGTDVSIPIWDVPSSDQGSEGPSVPDTDTDTDTDEDTDTEPAAEPFVDRYVPNYGSAPVYIRKNSDQPLRYWRSVLRTERERTTYDLLEQLTDPKTDTANMQKKVSFDDVKNVYHLFMMDHPEIFWNGTSYHGTGLEKALSTVVMRRLHGVEPALRMRSELEDAVEDIVALIPDHCTDFEAERILFDWLVENVTYDKNAPNAHSMYGALVDRRCVCAGYAEAFQYLCGRVGIPCFSIEGIADNGVESELHKWNAVQIGGKWYLADVTWADGRATASRYLYFNASDYIASQRTPNDPQGDLLPEFSSVAAEYLTYYGLSFNKNTFDDAFLRSVSRQTEPLKQPNLGAEVFLRAQTAADAEWAVDLLNTEDDPHVEELMRRLSATYGGEYLLASDAEIVQDRIIYVRVVIG